VISLRLLQVDCDNMENHDPIVKRLLGTFVGEEAHSMASPSVWMKLERHLEALSVGPLYLGNDGRVYPQYVIEKDRVL